MREAVVQFGHRPYRAAPKIGAVHHSVQGTPHTTRAWYKACKPCKRTAQGVNVLGHVVAANASCWLVVAPVGGVGGGGRALEAGVCRPAPGPSCGVPAVMEGEGGMIDRAMGARPRTPRGPLSAPVLEVSPSLTVPQPARWGHPYQAWNMRLQSL